MRIAREPTIKERECPGHSFRRLFGQLVGHQRQMSTVNVGSRQRFGAAAVRGQQPVQIGVELAEAIAEQVGRPGKCVHRGEDLLGGPVHFMAGDVDALRSGEGALKPDR